MFGISGKRPELPAHLNAEVLFPVLLIIVRFAHRAEMGIKVELRRGIAR